MMVILIRHNAGIIYNCGDEPNGLWNRGIIIKASRTTRLELPVEPSPNRLKITIKLRRSIGDSVGPHHFTGL
jgi:hypothetical protein